jgi:16S rRNA (guanine1516-N2)-methyltransferase
MGSECNWAMDGVPQLSRAPDGSLELRLEGERPGRGVAPRLGSLALVGLSRQPLIRALGRARGLVVDATAGLGGDAFLVAAAGFDVVALERHALLAQMLADEVARVRLGASVAHRAAAERMQVAHADSISALADTSPSLAWVREQPVAVLMDPMYPQDPAATALPAKPIRMVRSLVGDDADQRALFDAARACGPGRIVVKRPHSAPPLVPGPDLDFAGKLARLDVYLRAGALR